MTNINDVTNQSKDELPTNTPLKDTADELKNSSVGVTEPEELESDIDDNEDYDEDLWESTDDYDYDEDDYDYDEEDYSNLVPFPTETRTTDNFKLKIIMSTPKIVPFLKIPETVDILDFTAANILTPNTINIRNDNIYVIKTEELSDLELDNMILNVLVSNTLRHFNVEISEDVSEYSEFNSTYIDLLPRNTDKEYMYHPYTLTHAGMDLVTYYVIDILNKAKNNKTIMVSNVLEIKNPIIREILNNFTKFLENLTETPKNLVVEACRYLKDNHVKNNTGLLHNLYSNINRNEFNSGLRTHDTTLPLFEKYLATNDYDLSIYAVYSILTVVNNNGTERGRSYGLSSGGMSTRDSIFNALSFLSAIEELLKENNPNLLKAFRVLRESTAFNISRATADLYEERLSTLVGGTFQYDTSMAKPNRKYLSQGLLLPSPITNTIKLIFALDYSGSISQNELEFQLGIIDDILSTHHGYEAVILTFSDDIRTVTKLDDNDLLLDKLAEIGDNIGRQAGTSFQSVYNFIDNNEEDINADDLALVCIVSADGGGGRVTFSEEFSEKFKGRVVYLFDERFKSGYLQDIYVDSLADSDYSFITELLYYVSEEDSDK